MDTTTPTTISKYRVVRVLGRGGMGEVLLAEDDLGRRVAIKRPFVTASGDGLARFKVEARAATLSHPNIPVVYEMGTQDDGLPFIAMEFVEGEPLDKLISSGAPLDLLQKLSIVEQVCAGLGYAHAKGIIHRDIKPANIIVSASGVAKIIDFGIAKLTNVEQTSELTQVSQVIGSLHYIAPERFKAEAMDGRVDVFSAGVILYLLLTGTLPFSGGEMTASYRIVNEAHTSLGTHIKDYPPALDDIMDRALAKNPDDRFSTAEDFADALKEVIDDLKKSRINQLFSDAERLTIESRYDPALELLDEAMKLDPGNTQVRKLRRLVRDHQERRRKQDRVRESVSRAESLLAVENYAEALVQLKEAQRLDATSTELRDRIAAVETQKQRSERSAEAMAQAEAARNRGDITAALSFTENAIAGDPENTRLLAVRAALRQQLEREATQHKVNGLLDAAQQEFGRRNFPAMEALLDEAAALDAAHPRIEALRAELAQLREAEDRRMLVEEVRRRTNEFLNANQYEQASELLNRAIDKLPSEGVFHRLKMEVDTAARKFDSERFIDLAISNARQTFASDPDRALAGLRGALEQAPGNERLLALEQTLRQQAETLRMQRLLANTLREAREQLAAQQPQKAIQVLEAFQFEHGTQPEIDELLKVAQREQTGQRLRALVDKTSADVRELLHEDRLDEAVHLLENALQDPLIQSGDRTLAGLLESVRKQQSTAALKLDAVRTRAEKLRERGELDEAITLLREYLANNPRGTAVQPLLASLEADREQKQVTAQAVAAALEQARGHQYTQAFEALKGVSRAYGESDELTRAGHQVDTLRRSRADQVVAEAISTSRAALLRNDTEAALEALRASGPMVEFADAAKQADWRRIGQAAKKAQAEPPAAGAVIADPLADVPDAETPRKATPAGVWIGGAVVLVALLVAIGFLLLRKPAPSAAPAQASISIVKAPAGALVSIDGSQKKTTGADGSATLPVAPGQHLIEVTKDGFDPYTDKVQVQPGGTFSENVLMVKQPPASNSGTLTMQGNLPSFKVAVDGRSRGEILAKNGTLTLEAGSHTIRYSNDDGSDSQEHTVEIAAGKTTSDAFTLRAAQPPPPLVAKAAAPSAPAAPALGSLQVETTPNARVAVDGQMRGTADGSGRLTVSGLTAGSHTVDLSLDKYAPVSGRQVTVAANSKANFSQPLTALPPSAPAAGSISVATTPGAEISINGQRKGAVDGSGQFNLENLAPGSYQVGITLEHFQPTQVAVTVRPGSSTTLPVRLEPVPAATAKAMPPPAAEPAREADHTADYAGIQAAVNNLEAAYRSRNIGAVQANWTNMGPAVRKSVEGVFQQADVVNLSEKCQGQPVINGDTATQTCIESLELFKNQPARKFTKTLTFAKSGGKWVIKDKN